MAPPRPVQLQNKLQEDDPTLLPSEDEDDEDFRLSADEASGSGSDSDSDDEDGKRRAKKRAKVEEAPAEPAMTKSAIDDLWASFNDDSADPYGASSSSTSAAAPAAGSSAAGVGAAAGKGKKQEDEMVKIEIEYEYAGEKIAQEKLVPRSSIEAQAWLARYPKASSTSTGKPAAPAPAAPSTSINTAPSSLDALFGPSSAEPAHPAPATTGPSGEATKAGPPPKLGGAPKRKAGGGLAAAAAKLGVGKPAKLNTLEKSKMDWNKHVATTGDSDDLANARKDGYLEKKDFLDRVEVSREEGWERLKAGRRGKP
ncbi:hypothetical protein JCM10213_009113 [Rhodosporidiobolus nylandii]